MQALSGKRIVRQRPPQRQSIERVRHEAPVGFFLDRRMTGISFGWMDATTALASVARKPNSS